MVQKQGIKKSNTTVWMLSLKNVKAECTVSVTFEKNFWKKKNNNCNNKNLKWHGEQMVVGLTT